MNGKLLTDSADILYSLVGMSLTQCGRQIFESDFINYGLDEASYKGDGSVELKFTGRGDVFLIPHTTWMSVLIGEGKAPQWGASYRYHDVAETPFWASRLNSPINQIEIFKSRYADSEYPIEMALQIHLSNGLCFAVEYVSDEERLDSLVVSESFGSDECEVVLRIT